MPRQEREALQLVAVRLRFARLRDRALAEPRPQTGVEAIDQLCDVLPVCFDRMLKNYPLSILDAIAAFLFMAGAATLEGGAAIWSLNLFGLGHSIMFPTVFALGIKGPLTEEGSGLLITAIAGGGLVVVHGWLADTVSCRTRSG